MTRTENDIYAETRARIAEGRFVAGLVVRLEHLRIEADSILTKHDLKLEPVGTDMPELPPAEMYEAYAGALEDLLANQERPSVEKDDYTDDEGDAQKKVVELTFAKSVYRALANFLAAMHDPAPVDTELLARFILLGMDLGALSMFHAKVEGFEGECRTAAMAQERRAAIERQSASGRETKTKRTVWYPAAFVAHAAYLHINPRDNKGALFEAVRAVKSSADPQIKTTVEKLGNVESALARALGRHAAVYQEFAGAVKSVAEGHGESVQTDLRQSIVAALEEFATIAK